ncbi:MAG TPA: hypothetical protein VIT91_14015 [Chthoniobacterales bacterium]
MSMYAVMSLAWGLGAVAGPSTAGFAVELTTHGVPLFAAAAYAAFAIFAWRVKSEV